MRQKSEPLPLTVEETAERLRVDPSVIYRMVADGRLPAARVGRVLRIAPDDVADLFVALPKENSR